MKLLLLSAFVIFATASAACGPDGCEGVSVSIMVFMVLHSVDGKNCASVFCYFFCVSMFFIILHTLCLFSLETVHGKFYLVVSTAWFCYCCYLFLFFYLCDAFLFCFCLRFLFSCFWHFDVWSRCVIVHLFFLVLCRHCFCELHIWIIFSIVSIRSALPSTLLPLIFIFYFLSWDCSLIFFAVMLVCWVCFWM